MNFSIQFKSYQQTSDYFTYEIEVKNESETWVFHRRYSNLRLFYSQLPPILLIFPPKKYFGNKNPKFLDQRQKDLDQFFKNLLKIPNILEFPAVKSFLFPNDRIVVSQSPCEEKKAVKEVKPGSDSKLVSQKIIDFFHLKLFDLSSQPMPLEEDDYKIKEKSYKDSLKDVKVGKLENKLVENEEDLSEVVKNDWIVKAFDSLVQVFPETALNVVNKFY